MTATGLRVGSPLLLVAVIVTSVVTANLMSFGFMAAQPAVRLHAVEVLAELMLAFFAIVLLTVLRSWRTVGFHPLERLSDLRFYWIPLFPVLPVLAAAGTGVSRMSSEDVVFFLVLACLVGFVEEVFFRGLVLRVLVPTGLWKAAVLSSGLFGLMHLLNLLSGADLAGTLLQSVYAAAMGFGFAAVTLRTGVLWPLIVIHALMDFAGFVTSGGTVGSSLKSTDVILSVLYILLFVAYGIVLLKRTTRSGARRRARPGSADAAGPDSVNNTGDNTTYRRN